METSSNAAVHFAFNFATAALTSDENDDNDDENERAGAPGMDTESPTTGAAEAVETPGVVLPTKLLDSFALLETAQRELQSLGKKAAQKNKDSTTEDGPRVQEVALGSSPKLWRISGVDWADFGTCDLVPGKYGGGLRLWECAVDLCQYLQSCLVAATHAAEASSSSDTFWHTLQSTMIQRAGMEEFLPWTPPSTFCSKGSPRPFSILELGCGHGLAGILVWKESPDRENTRLVLADYNDFVLQQVTAKNLLLNSDAAEWKETASRVQFVAGDWMSLDTVLADARTFPLVLAAETTFSRIAALQTAQLMARHLEGLGLVATKRYYFGVGGGSAPFVEAVQQIPTLETRLVQVYDDGRGNIRELWMVWRV